MVSTEGKKIPSSKERTLRFSRLLTSVVTVALAGAVLPVHPAIAAPTCFGKRATIVGTNRDKSEPAELKGTPGNDVIVGLSGYDYIDARGGDDLICAGGGDDWIEAGSGDDKVMGQGGIDEIRGGGGHDRIWGGRGPAEVLVGGGGNDRLFGGAGTEDLLIGGPGDDVMNGGRGLDIVLFADSPQGVHADLRTGEATGHGNDRMVSLESLHGTFLNDVLYGDDGANTLGGGPGDDELYGLGGDDRLRSGEWNPSGTDLLDGGEGRDTAWYYLSWDAVQADLTTGQAVTSGVDTLVGIENLFGSKHNDTLIGDDGNNDIQGSLGDDVMDARGGTDTAMFRDSFELVIDLVEGTAVEDRGSDTLENFENVIGSTFADTIIGDDGPNSIWGGSGADTLSGAGGDDMLIGERGNDNVNGGDGTDICDGETEIECELDPAAAIYSMDRREFDAVPPRPAMEFGMKGDIR
jgi:Ca2+-binding RTX toxin-like protein